MSTLLIRGGTVVSESGKQRADVWIEGEKISGLLRRDQGVKVPRSADRVITASGMYVFAGGIDAHTHMELPLGATTASDTFESGTLAALAGGTTTILDFANQTRGRTLMEAVAAWHEKADGHAACDYGFHVSVTDFNPRTRGEIAPMISREGISSFKTFMAYPDTLMLSDKALRSVLEAVAVERGIVTVHAEDGIAIQKRISEVPASKRSDPRSHAKSRPSRMEVDAAKRIVALAAEVDCPLYLVHMSTAGAVDVLRKAKSSGQRVWGETCTQYLLLDESVYALPDFEGAKYVMSPPLRTKKDQDALWAAIADGTIDVVATDHCPFNMSQKELGRNDFTHIPNGGPGVEHRIELLHSYGVVSGRITIEKLVEVVSAAPARLFGLAPRKGQIVPGADADLVIFDPNAKQTITARSQLMRCDYSMYEGWAVTGECIATVLRGKVVHENGRVSASGGEGKFLKRAPFTVE